jgi:hypothetical protein
LSATTRISNKRLGAYWPAIQDPWQPLSTDVVRPFALEVDAGDFAFAPRHRRCVAISQAVGTLRSFATLSRCDSVVFVGGLDGAEPRWLCARRGRRRRTTAAAARASLPCGEYRPHGKYLQSGQKAPALPANKPAQRPAPEGLYSSLKRIPFEGNRKGIPKRVANRIEAGHWAEASTNGTSLF